MRHKRSGVPWLIVTFCALMILVMFVLSLFVPVHGRDLDGHYAASPLGDWIKGLRSPAGGLCCEEADGHRIDDVDWRGEADGSYSVRIEGAWVKLNADQVVREPNRLGSAMVWIWQNRITCFLPGAGT